MVEDGHYGRDVGVQNSSILQYFNSVDIVYSNAYERRESTLHLPNRLNF